MRTLRPILAALAAAAALLAGCSSTEQAPPADTPPGDTSTSVPSEHGGFAHCLEEHGVPAPPGPVAGPPPGVDAQQWQHAMESCSTLAPGPSGS